MAEGSEEDEEEKEEGAGGIGVGMRLLWLLHESLRSGLRGMIGDADRMAEEEGARNRLGEGLSLLHAVYREHSDAEDEVIFPALGARVPNVVDGYALEHEHEDKLFSELESALDRLDTTDARCKAHALRSKVLLHLEKEERQLFPMLEQNFTRSEQMNLLWAFFCQLPVRLGGRILRWVLTVLPRNRAHELEQLLDTIAPGPSQRRIMQAWLSPASSSSSSSRSKRSRAARSGSEDSPSIHLQPLSLLTVLEDALKAELKDWVDDAKHHLQQGLEDGASTRLTARRRLLLKAARSARRAAARFCTVDEGEVGNFVGDDSQERSNEADEEAEKIDIKAGLAEVESALRSEWATFGLKGRNEAEENQVAALKAVAFAMPLSALERLLGRMKEQEAASLLSLLRPAAAEEELPLLDLLEEECVRGSTETAHARGESVEADDERAGKMARPAQNAERGAKDASSAEQAVTEREELEDLPAPRSRDEGKRERQPIDHIFEFHTALRLELRALEQEARHLDEDTIVNEEGRVTEQASNFDGRFCFIWGVYWAHSKSEDNNVFPALESKVALSNVSSPYTLDHEQEEELFKQMDSSLSKIRSGEIRDKQAARSLVRELQGLTTSVRRSVELHVKQEEQHLWPLFLRYFSTQEQSRVVGDIIGCTGAEGLLATLQWVSRGFSQDQMASMLESMRRASENTSFSEWLDRWWPGASGKGTSEVGLCSQQCWQPGWSDIFRMNQMHLEESAQEHMTRLGTKERTFLFQSLAAARWAAWQQEHAEKSRQEQQESSEEERDKMGCQHYSRKCKLVAKCCGKEYWCRVCHDASESHSMERAKTEEMRCMLCEKRQPIGTHCAQCSARMALYFCSLCRFFEDDGHRPVYHCQFCNLCRRGKGLGIDMFHCMQCNTCMSVQDKDRHTCIRSGLEQDCPICSDFLFTSELPVKQLPCGHYMHSECFLDHTKWRYTCPLCRKSIGDMSAYFRMLDQLVASQPMPAELRDKRVPVLCNDCERHGEAVFHFAYLKCPSCGSYNTASR